MFEVFIVSSKTSGCLVYTGNTVQYYKGAVNKNEL